MKKITDEEVEGLANLSALAFSKEQLAKMKEDLLQTFSFVEKIESVNVNEISIQKTTVTLGELRDDIPQPSISNEEALKNAPKAESGCYVVPKVVD